MKLKRFDRKSMDCMESASCVQMVGENQFSTTYLQVAFNEVSKGYLVGPTRPVNMVFGALSGFHNELIYQKKCLFYHILSIMRPADNCLCYFVACEVLEDI